MALVLLPVYICAKYLEVLPAAIKHSTMLLSTDGRERLVQSAKDYRQQEKKRADLQMQGDFAFQPNELLTGEKARGSSRTCTGNRTWSNLRSAELL